MSKKSKLQLRLEAERAQKENLDGILKYHKSFSSKPERILKQIKKPNLPWHYVANTLVIVKYSALVHLIANYTFFPEIRKLISVILKKKASCMFAYPELVNALPAIADNSDSYLRAIEEWKPQSRKPYQLFGELIQHLFVRYPIPAFLQNTFFNASEEWIEGCISIAQGESAFEVLKPPFEWTKKMAHYFLQAPDNFTILQAFRYAQVMGLTNKNEHLALGLSQTYLGTTFENHEFWESLIFQLAPFTNLDFSFLNDLVDALQFLKYGSLHQRATQPKLALQDRDLGNLGKLIGNAEIIKKMHKVWKGLPIEDFSTQWQKTTFQIIQLRSAYSLSVEGNEMKNCVGGYAGSCREGRTSIWVLVENSKGYFQRIANIEVTKQRVVRQIKAKANKPLSEDYMQIVWQWVGKEGLLVESNFSQ